MNKCNGAYLNILPFLSSRVFQRFAIRTNENLKEAVKKGQLVQQLAAALTPLLGHEG